MPVRFFRRTTLVPSIVFFPIDLCRFSSTTSNALSLILLTAQLSFSPSEHNTFSRSLPPTFDRYLYTAPGFFVSTMQPAFFSFVFFVLTDADSFSLTSLDRRVHCPTCSGSLGRGTPNYQMISGYINRFYSLHSWYYSTNYTYFFFLRD